MMTNPHPTRTRQHRVTPTPPSDPSRTLVGARTYPSTRERLRRAALARWRAALVVAVLVGVLGMALRAAYLEQGAPGVWLAIGSLVVAGVPAAIEWYGRPLPPRTNKWR